MAQPRKNDSGYNRYTMDDAEEIILKLKEENAELRTHVEGLKEACNNYIPSIVMDEANDAVVLFCKGSTEESGRAMLGFIQR